MSDSSLPFCIRAKATRNDICLFIAEVNGQRTATARYGIGNTKRRTEIAALWAVDPQLHNGSPISEVVLVERELQAAELHAIAELDERDELEAIETAARIECAVENDGGGGDEPPKKSQATQLVDLVNAVKGLELWHDPDGNGLATIPVGEHFENWPIRSRRFRQWSSKLFYDTTEKVPGGQGMQDAITTIEGQAVHRGAEYQTFARIGERDETMYLDLCDADWHVARVTAQGWNIMVNPPIKFRRAHAMMPLPIPVVGGDLNKLKPFINVAGNQFILVTAWLVGALRPHGPYAILELNGEQGSAKSTACKVLRRLVDPNKADLRSDPRDERDLVIAAENGWVIGYDNMSLCPPWLSDALCRISTGAGFGTRELFSDRNEVIFSETRPVLVNGINEVALRSDLLDRTIRVTLPTITESKRKTEAEFWNEFEAERPLLLGSILTAVSTALRDESGVRLHRAPRMADFARWIVAAEPALPWKPDEFLTAYGENREAANESVFEGFAVAGVVRRWVEASKDKWTGTAKDKWIGTATDLLERLDAYAGVDRTKRLPDGWPKAANSLARIMHRIAPNLRGVGIEVAFDDKARPRTITLGTSKQKTDRTDKTDGDREKRTSESTETDGKPTDIDGANRPGGVENAGSDDGVGSDDLLPVCSSCGDDDSDAREAAAIAAVEAEVDDWSEV